MPLGRNVTILIAAPPGTPFAELRADSVVPAGNAGETMMGAAKPAAGAVLIAIQPLAQLLVLHVNPSVEGQTLTVTSCLRASLRAAFSAITSVFVCVICRSFCTMVRIPGKAIETRMAAIVRVTSTSTSVKPLVAAIEVRRSFLLRWHRLCCPGLVCNMMVAVCSRGAHVKRDPALIAPSVVLDFRRTVGDCG